MEDFLMDYHNMTQKIHYFHKEIRLFDDYLDTIYTQLGKTREHEHEQLGHEQLGRLRWKMFYANNSKIS